MKITNDTTINQVLELMGDEADEQDARIMMSLLLRDCVTDTDEIDFDTYLQEVCKIRAQENRETSVENERENNFMSDFYQGQREAFE